MRKTLSITSLSESSGGTDRIIKAYVPQLSYMVDRKGLQRTYLACTQIHRQSNNLARVHNIVDL